MVTFDSVVKTSKNIQIHLAIPLEFLISSVFFGVNKYKNGEINSTINSIAVLLFLLFFVHLFCCCFFSFFKKSTTKILKNYLKVFFLIIFSIIFYLFVEEQISGKKHPLDLITNNKHKGGVIFNQSFKNTRIKDGLTFVFKPLRLIKDTTINKIIAIDNKGEIYNIDKNYKYIIDSLSNNIDVNSQKKILPYNDSIINNDTLNVFELPPILGKLADNDNVWFKIRRFVTYIFNSLFDYLFGDNNLKYSSSPEYIFDTIKQNVKILPNINYDTIIFINCDTASSIIVNDTIVKPSSIDKKSDKTEEVKPSSIDKKSDKTEEVKPSSIDKKSDRTEEVKPSSIDKKSDKTEEVKDSTTIIKTSLLFLTSLTNKVSFPIKFIGKDIPSITLEFIDEINCKTSLIARSEELYYKYSITGKYFNIISNETNNKIILRFKLSKNSNYYILTDTNKKSYNLKLNK